MESKMNKRTEYIVLTNMLPKKKKMYNSPKIIELGAMQKVTLGGSQVIGDSGSNPPLAEN